MEYYPRNSNFKVVRGTRMEAKSGGDTTVDIFGNKILARAPAKVKKLNYSQKQEDCVVGDSGTKDEAECPMNPVAVSRLQGTVTDWHFSGRNQPHRKECVIAAEVIDKVSLMEGWAKSL